MWSVVGSIKVFKKGQKEVEVNLCSESISAVEKLRVCVCTSLLKKFLNNTQQTTLSQNLAADQFGYSAS